MRFYKSLRIKMDEDQKKQLMKNAEEKGLTISDYVRKRLFEKVLTRFEVIELIKKYFADSVGRERGKKKRKVGQVAILNRRQKQASLGKRRVGGGDFLPRITNSNNQNKTKGRYKNGKRKKQRRKV